MYIYYYNYYYYINNKDMQFIITILYTYFFLFTHFITNFNININIMTYINNLFIINKYLMGWKLLSTFPENYYMLDNIDNDKYILALFNHPTLIDSFFCLKYLINKFPEHEIVFVIKEELTKLFLIGNYFKKHHICIKRNFDQDKQYIINKINSIKLNNKKTIIVLFPEGTTFCKETILKSNNWCLKNNIDNFKNIIAPRILGYNLIKEHFMPNIILNNIIIYLDDLKCNKSRYENDIFKCNKNVSICNIHTNIVDIDKDITNLWRENDNYINNYIN